MAKRKSRRARARMDTNAAQFARAGNPWDGDRELRIKRNREKASLFGPARKIANVGENRSECAAFEALAARRRIFALVRGDKPRPAPDAFIKPRDARRGLVSKEVIERKLAEPETYPAPKPLVDEKEARRKRAAHKEWMRRELEKALESLDNR